ncbi:hypothetical protein [Streptomyces sp. NPDC058701]|uniref:hypothetical protein n=1 Tax=Streptomyces sp. NPDC058701 TaxID=3346608 RepID=UPI003661E808
MALTIRGIFMRFEKSIASLAVSGATAVAVIGMSSPAQAGSSLCLTKAVSSSTPGLSMQTCGHGLMNQANGQVTVFMTNANPNVQHYVRDISLTYGPGSSGAGYGGWTCVVMKWMKNGDSFKCTTVSNAVNQTYGSWWSAQSTVDYWNSSLAGYRETNDKVSIYVDGYYN